MRRHRLILIRPREAFDTPARAVLIGKLPGLVANDLQYFGLPAVAVVAKTDGRPDVAACNFLLDKAVTSRGSTGDTARSYGEALCDWLDYLEASECNPNHATEERLALYRLHLLNREGDGQLRGNTINHRLIVAAEFQRWGQRSRELVSPLGAYLETSQRSSSGRGGFRLRTRNPNSYLAPADKRLPRVLTREEIVRLFKVAPRPFDLMFRWAIATGMRRFEICSLRLEDLPSPEAVSRAEGGLIMIDVTRKGGRMQSVSAPAGLIEQTHWYVLSDRNGSCAGEGHRLFLGRGGVPISRHQLSRKFRMCADAIGSRATLHHLRHTFAVNVLQALDSYEGEGQAMNPLKCVQVLLGHASIESTQIYLRAMAMSSDAVRQALDYLYGGTLEPNP